MGPSATYRSAITTALPAASISVDHWHLFRLANLVVTSVRQRVAREWLGRRGRATEGAWAHRMLLLRAGNTLTPRLRPPRPGLHPRRPPRELGDQRRSTWLIVGG